MSTTFAIRKKDKNGNVTNEIQIAHRSGQGAGKPVKIEWLNSVVSFLNKKMKVYPVDNTRQGVYNIGDLRKLQNEYNKDEIEPYSFSGEYHGDDNAD